MDACQKHLMLPWMKTIGGRGRDQVWGRAGAVLSSLLLCLCCVHGAFGMRWLAYSKEVEESGWGVEGGLPESSTDKLTLSFSAILSDSSYTILNTHSEFRVGLRPWALASHLTTATSKRGVSGHPAPTLRRNTMLSVDHNKGFIYQVGHSNFVLKRIQSVTGWNISLTLLLLK